MAELRVARTRRKPGNEFGCPLRNLATFRMPAHAIQYCKPKPPLGPVPVDSPDQHLILESRDDARGIHDDEIILILSAPPRS